MKFIVLTAGLVIALAAACSASSDSSSGNSEPGTPVSDPLPTPVVADFESCSGLLDVDDVREAADRIDVEIAAPNVNSGTASPNDVGMKAMCIYEYVTPEINVGGPAGVRVSGPSLTLTGILFDSIESAEVHYQFSLDNIQLMKDATNPGMEITEGTLGDESYLLTVDAERVGSMMGFRSGQYILSLHTTLPDGEDPIVGPQDLVSLADAVQEHVTTN